MSCHLSAAYRDSTEENLSSVIYGVEVTTEFAELVQEDAIEGKYCLYVTTRQNKSPWELVLTQSGLVFQEGIVYTLAAFLKSPDKLRLNFRLELGVSPWIGYGVQTFTMTEEWEEYYVTTPPMPEDVLPGAFSSHIAYDTGEFYIDNVRLYEGEYVPAGAQPSNRLPSLSFSPPSPYVIAADSSLTITVTAEDADSDVPVITTGALPQNADFTDGTLTFSPSIAQVGEYSIEFTADDGEGGVVTETIAISVQKTLIARMDISPSTATLRAGETQQFAVSAYDASDQAIEIAGADVTWTVDNNIGTVDENGLFTATTVGSGNTRVTLKADTNITTQSESVTVEAGALTQLTISEPPSELKAGETHQFIATGVDAYGNHISIQSDDVSWSVGGGIGSIDAAGLLSATTVGTGSVGVTLKAETSISASITFSIAAPSQLADFVVSAPQSEVTVKADEVAAYIIMLEGENGFSDEVELFDSELPGNVEAVFDPKKVTLSEEDTLATSQLTLTVPADIVPGEHLFTVIAIPGSGETKQLKLILNIEPVDLAVTTLTLILQPAEVEFMGEVSALGQLAAISDTPVELDDAVIQMIFTAPSGETYTHEATTDAEGSFQLPAPFLPDEVGEWRVKAQFDSNKQLKTSQRERSLTVGKGQSEIVFDTGTGGALGTKTMILGRLEPQLEDELISLKILSPDGSASTLIGIATEILGVFRYRLNLDMAGDWAITATWPGSDNWETVTRTLVISVSAEMGKAIIVLGGGNRVDNPAWATFNRVAEYVYRVFLRRNFDGEKDIYFLSPELKATVGADHETSLAELEQAITNWAAKNVNAQIPLYLYLLSHNLGDQFLLEKRGNHETYLTPAQLDEWLDQLPAGTQVTIIIEACYSGNFIRTPDDKLTALVGQNRTIITSARGDKQAKILPNRSSFSKAFFDRIGANKTVGEAFRETELLMERMPFHRDQYPQMDADGDGRINTPQDYAEMAHRYFPADMVSLAHPPNIIDIIPSQVLPEGINSLRIYAELLGIDITRVSATVIPPDYDSDQEISNWSDLSFPEFDLAEVSVEDNRYGYAAAYSDFTIPGDYTIIINAENPDGSADPVQTTITVAGGVKGDVNSDGMVNSGDAMLTLRMAAGEMEPTGYQRWSADMNDDGRIMSNDAILILLESVGLAAPARNATTDPRNEVTVTLSEAYGEAGDSLTVSLAVDDSSHLAGGDISLHYDPSVLYGAEVSRQPGVLLADNVIEPGAIRIAFVCANGLNNGTIAKIQFRIIKDEITPIKFRNVELYRSDAVPVDSIAVDGLFNSWTIAPEYSMLLQNYPNPFNPETWIPYQLSEASNISITIYDLTGKSVRYLNLGHRPAGTYQTQETAVHWDGRNNEGECVASGVYFAVLMAGEHQQTLRMVLSK